MSNNVKAVVKSAVTETIRAHHHDLRISESVVIYGLPKGKDDLSRVSSLLEDEKLEFIAHVSRIGKLPTSTTKSSKPCPLRVDFSDIEDRNWVLNNARRLTGKLKNKKVRISKFLSMAELAHITALRDECSKLNRINPSKSDGNVQFIVINDCIMERNTDGKLRHYATQKSSNVDELPKENKSISLINQEQHLTSAKPSKISKNA